MARITAGKLVVQIIRRGEVVQTHDEIKARLLASALPNVAFDGYTQAVFDQAVADCGVDAGMAALICPAGATDLAAFAHESDDRKMSDILAGANWQDMRIRDRITFAIQIRLKIAAQDKEVVRRSAAHFALPQNGARGTALIWGTADTIWRAFGDTSEDVNFYTKRATLAAIYSATLLYWLGDDSVDADDTQEFLHRRIENVMQFEKLKSGLGKLPFSGRLLDLANKAAERARKDTRFQGMPGSVGKQK